MILRNENGARIHLLAYLINGVWHWKMSSEDTTNCRKTVDAPLSSGRENITSVALARNTVCNVCHTVNVAIESYRRAERISPFDELPSNRSMRRAQI